MTRYQAACGHPIRQLIKNNADRATQDVYENVLVLSAYIERYQTTNVMLNCNTREFPFRMLKDLFIILKTNQFEHKNIVGVEFNFTKRKFGTMFTVLMHRVTTLIVSSLYKPPYTIDSRNDVASFFILFWTRGMLNDSSNSRQ